jgi:SAM-dependent methyltransferase
MIRAECPVSAVVDSSDVKVPCPCCDGETDVVYDLAHIWHQPAGSTSYEIRGCQRCDFGFLHPHPGKNEIARLTEQSLAIADDWPELIPPDPSIFERIRVHLAWRVSHAMNRQITAQRIHEFVGGRPVSLYIFGCGKGDILRELGDLGHKAAGIEQNEPARQLAVSQGLRVHPGSVQEPPAALFNEPVDVVILPQVLQTCPDPDEALTNVRQLLKPGGVLMADVPNHGAYLARRSGPAWILCDAGRNLNFYTSRSLSRFVAQNGFQVVDLLYCNYTVQFRRPRLAIERMIWDSLYVNAGTTRSRIPPRKSPWELWHGLLRSAFRGPDEKYEILGIIARKEDA